MLCPRCNEELVEGHLYCDHCGYEIRIVPDFEPEIDKHLESSISTIKNDLYQDDMQDKMSENKIPETKRTPKEWLFYLYQNEKTKFYGLCLGVLALVFALCIGGVMLVHTFSPDYQNRLGNKAQSNEEFEKAIAFYTRSLELDETNFEVYFSLFDCYYALDLKQEAVDTMLTCISQTKLTKAKQASAYEYIASIYIENEQYLELNEVLLTCENKEILAKYDEFIVDSVTFSYNEGSYNEVIPLKLTSKGSGNIYYTLDGTIPTTQSEVYSGPIFLRNGEYHIFAVVINDYGVSGSVAEKTYYIDSVVPYAAEISAYSGNYTAPTLITALVPDNCSIYYTTDGSTPTNESILYEKPIPMPLDKSEFKFISYADNGVYGEIIVRNYTLELQTEYLYTDAQRDIYSLMIEKGNILDYTGVKPDSSDIYQYVFKYCLRMEEMGDFYIIGESIRNTQNEVVETGKNFAVDIYTGKVYQAQIHENMDCVLTPFET